MTEHDFLREDDAHIKLDGFYKNPALSQFVVAEVRLSRMSSAPMGYAQVGIRL